MLECGKTGKLERNLTEDDARRLLATPDKIVILPVQWVREAGGHLPAWMLFESAIRVGGELPEGLRFRARYRPPKIITKGDARIEIGENFNAAIFTNNDLRIAAIDTNPGQRHLNKVGVGMPYFGQTVSTDTHRHVWTGQYGYVEPVEPPIYDVVKLLEFFAEECNLSLTGSIVHPRSGEQGKLL